MGRPRLSLCMIVRDEIDCLQRCIDSVWNVVDEIAIVDTGSTDGTLELAKRYASRFAQIVWIDDFSYARNISIQMATGDWILVLDADDYLREQSRFDLLESLRASDVLSYRLVIHDHHDGGFCVASLCTRLFRRMPTLRYSGKIHEQVTPALLDMAKTNPGWRNATLDGVIVEHDGYMQGRMEKRGKRSRNIRLLRMALEEAPSDIYRRYKLAQALGLETDDGCYHLSLALEALLQLSDPEIQQELFAHELLGNAALRLAQRNEPAKALRVCAIAEALFDRHPVLSYVRALSCYLSQDMEEALSSANEALAMAPPPNGFVFNDSWLRQEIYLLISRIRQHRGEYAAAVHILKSALSEFPNSQELVHSILRCALAAQTPLLALDYGAKWMKSNGSDAQSLLLCAEAAEIYGDLTSAQRWRSLAARSIGGIVSREQAPSGEDARGL